MTKLRKRIAVIFCAGIMAVSLTGCDTSVFKTANVEKAYDPDTIDATDSMFVVVENTPTWIVVYHKETKVMYAVSDNSYNYGNFTLLVDADGKPLLYDGE